MSSCNEYNQYYNDIIDSEGNLVTTKCFDGKEIYLTQKAFKVNNFKNYNNIGYYAWIDKNFKDYSFSEDNFDSEEYEPEKQFNEICNNVSYSLKQQQKFAGRIFNTNTDINGMLIYHGLGSGKTQTSIVVGEAFKYRTVNNRPIKGRSDTRVFIVVPAALQEQYYREIIGRYDSGFLKSASGQILIMGERQFYTDKFVRESLERFHNEIINLTKERNLLIKNKGSAIEINAKQNQIQNYMTRIKQLDEDEKTKISIVYEILSHESFLNKLFVIDNDGKYIPQFLENNKGRLDYLQNPNGLLIIDEIQNLVSATGTNYRRLLYALRYHTHPKFKVILLTGTPIYDKPYEFGLLMNLLRPRVIFPDGRDSFNEIFLQNGVFSNEEYFKKMCSGYVSYFKGGNPIAYPYKKTTIMHHKMNEEQYSQYKIALIKEVSKDQKNILQDEDYFINLKNEDRINSGIFHNSNQIANIAFPQYRGTKHVKDKLQANIEQFKVDLKSETIKIPGKLLEQLSKEELMSIDSLSKGVLSFVGRYSSKFAKVAEMIIECEGPVFVFSNFVYFGVNAMGIIMDYLGYTPYGSSPGPRGSYFIWNGEANSKNKAGVRAAYDSFNSPENMNGDVLKVIFGTQTVMEGVDFKNVSQIHILDPWWNDSRIQQIIARGIRLCSHKNLPPERRVVNVFIHLSTLGSFENVYYVNIIDSNGQERRVKSFMQIENIEAPKSEWVIREAYSTQPDKEGNVEIKNSTSKKFLVSQIITGGGEAENISGNIIRGPDQSLLNSFEVHSNWKGLASRSVQEYMYERSLNKLSINRKFERAVKEIAIDCTINKNGNIIRLDELYTPNIQKDGTWNLVYQNYFTGETYTRLNTPKSFTLNEILQNTALRSQSYNFKNMETGEEVKINKSLILPENIKCNTLEYSFKFPKQIVTLTINKEMIPMLLNMYKKNKIQFNKFLLDIMNGNPPLINEIIDPKLSKKLLEFMLKKSKKRDNMVEDLKNFGFTNDDTLWEKLNKKEIENLHKLYIK